LTLFGHMSIYIYKGRIEKKPLDCSDTYMYIYIYEKNDMYVFTSFEKKKKSFEGYPNKGE
jgi:hypothetical protein